MDDGPIEQMTLRELFTHAEFLVRELNEHLQQSFLPRLRSVEELVRSHNKPQERDEIADSTVRSRMSTLLASDDFSQKLLTRLERFLAAINEGAERAVRER